MIVRRSALTIYATLSISFPISAADAAAPTPAPALKTLYYFEPASGPGPNGLALGSGGALYGTTTDVAGGAGTVYSLKPPAPPGGSWTETVLYSFTGGGDGGAPYAGVVIGKKGALYGTTRYGGAFNPNCPQGCGTVFSLAPPTSPGGPWVERVLYAFTGGNDGAYPFAAVVIGSGGGLFGTTQAGGPSNVGTVFRLIPPSAQGGVWTETVLHSFAGSDGSAPQASVVIGKGGVLYGTTAYGGNFSVNCSLGCGTVFSLAPPASPEGSWTEAILHEFTYGEDGLLPGGVVIGGGGVLYGTTESGGISAFAGTVFSLTPPTSTGGAWTEDVLYSLKGFPGDGGSPFAGVVIGSGGVLYGTTDFGGLSTDWGTVFSLAPPASPGGAWTETVLYSFTGGSDGGFPLTGLVIGARGVLYGTTNSAYGTVFALKL